MRCDLHAGCEGVSFIYLVQDRIQWQTQVNKVMNLWDVKQAKNFLSGTFNMTAPLKEGTEKQSVI
jgi:hypothetical protein